LINSTFYARDGGGAGEAEKDFSKTKEMHCKARGTKCRDLPGTGDETYY